MIPTEVEGWLLENDYGQVKSSAPVAGGCINNGARIVTEKGNLFFLKTNSNAPINMFQREAEGLRELNVEDGPRVPHTYIYGDDFLLLEYLEHTSRTKDYWEIFGRKLAALHNIPNPKYGFTHDNYIGSTPQPNSFSSSGYEFFGQHRLTYQALLAEKQGYIHSSEVAQIDSISKKLQELVPQQPPSLLHGDLWSGNAIADECGLPAIIDHAVYFGWAEAELAMTALFGGFPKSFYAAYNEVRDLTEGWRERFPIYNLYHLLNHLNLFGRGYYSQVMNIVNRYA